MKLPSKQFNIPPEGKEAINAFIAKYNIESKVEIKDENYFVTLNGHQMPKVPACEHINQDNAPIHLLGMLSTWIGSLFCYGYSYEDWCATNGGDTEESVDMFVFYMAWNRNLIMFLFKSDAYMYADFIECGRTINNALNNILNVD